MPNRPPKRNRLAGRHRPSWNQEPDYWIRENQRVRIVEAIKKTADSFHETENICTGCDFPIWEARRGDIVYRGCHCGTILLPPGHQLRTFDPKVWSETFDLANAFSDPAGVDPSHASGAN